VAASKMIGNALESLTKTLPARRSSSEESYRKYDISHLFTARRDLYVTQSHTEQWLTR